MNDEDLQREYEQIGARIRNARIEQKMSQADLAAKANISLPHISAIELGKTKMLLSTFIRVIEAFANISGFGAEGERTSSNQHLHKRDI